MTSRSKGVRPLALTRRRLQVAAVRERRKCHQKAATVGRRAAEAH
jgi:hypothetical protein